MRGDAEGAGAGKVGSEGQGEGSLYRFRDLLSQAAADE